VCEAELWEEALIELKRQNYSPMVKKEEVVWLAKIYLGMERYQDVLHLQQRARVDGCDITPFLAVANARLDKHEKALVLAKEALDNRQDGAKRALGDVYFVAGDFEHALYWYEQVARSWLEYAAGIALVGKALFALGEYREATVAYERAVRMASFRRDDDLGQLAECYRKTGRDSLAAELEQLIENP
jgi:tetratricopeptide (TPR) repeat protein